MLIWLTLVGCSAIATPSNVVWTAQPPFIEVDHPLFLAKIEPQKGISPYYAFFLLTITNRSDTDLIVDWNASQYLFNGRPHGVFVFEGIDPVMLKTATVPSETVVPGAVFSREIMPMKLIAWSPIKEETAGGRSITPGMLPAGENGIRLAVQHKKEAITIPLSIRIEMKDKP